MKTEKPPLPSGCVFYHTVDIPGHETITGYWDLRGRETEYLGNISLRGKRVLEIGPASGHLTFFMERQGARVISLETCEDHPWEFFWDLPVGRPPDLESKTAHHREHMRAIRNSYNFCRSSFSSGAELHLGNAYNLPDSIGEVDVAVIGSVLLHNKNPLRIVEECARVTRETVVIAELYDPAIGHLACMNFLPTSNLHAWDTWWSFSPSLFVQVLASMGFTQTSVNMHRQKSWNREVDYFTVVASKPRDGQVRTGSERLVDTADVSFQCATTQLQLSVNDLTYLHVRVRNSAGEALTTTSPFPVHLSYHWRHKSGKLSVWDGVRTKLPWSLASRDSADVSLAVRAPSEPGDYVLELTLVQEEVSWFDGKCGNLPLRVPARIV